VRTVAIAASVLVLVSVGAAAGPRSLNEGYVGCSTSDKCISFDLVTYAIGATIELLPGADYPYDATMRPDGSEVWFCGAVGDSVLVVDRATNTVTHRIPVGLYPNSIVFTDDAGLALVSARDGDLVTLISTSSYLPVGTLDVTTGSGGTYDGPGNLALDPASGRIYAADWYGTKLHEIAPDGSAVLNSVTLGVNLWQLVVDPEGQYVYVTDRGPDVVRVIDRATLTEVRQVAVGTDPWGIDVTLDGSKLVVACEDDHTVRIINTADWTTTTVTLDSTADPRDVDILDASGYAFVAGGQITGGNPLYVVDLATNSLKDTISIPSSNVNVVAVQGQTTSAMTGVAEGEAALTLHIQCYPNPSSPAATVRYTLHGPARVTLAVYDAAGRKVAALEPESRGGGIFEAHWDGRDGSGAEVAAGVYFVRLATNRGSATGRITVVK